MDVYKAFFNIQYVKSYRKITKLYDSVYVCKHQKFFLNTTGKVTLVV